MMPWSLDRQYEAGLLPKATSAAKQEKPGIEGCRQEQRLGNLHAEVAWTSAVPLPCSLVHKAVRSFLLAWLGLCCLATQCVPNNQKPEVNETVTCKSKWKHLLLAIKLWNEPHRTVKNYLQKAAHLKVPRNEVGFHRTLKVSFLV